MAWRMLGVCHFNSNRGDPKFKDYYKKAFELSEGLPPRERYVIQGEYYQIVEINLDKALEVLDKLLRDYPEHLLGNRIKYSIGSTRRTDWKIVVELSEKNYRNFPENAQVVDLLGVRKNDLAG